MRSDDEARDVQPDEASNSFSLFCWCYYKLGRRLTCGEMSFHLFCLDILLIQSVYPNDQRKSVCRHSWLSVIRVSAYQYNFRNENNVSVLIDPVRNHLTVGTRVCQSDFARQYRIRHPNKTQKKNVYRHSEDEFEFVDQSSLFIMEMVFRSLYTQQEIISLQKRVPCFRLMPPSHLLISVSVSK